MTQIGHEEFLLVVTAASDLVRLFRTPFLSLLNNYLFSFGAAFTVRGIALYACVYLEKHHK